MTGVTGTSGSVEGVGTGGRCVLVLVLFMRLGVVVTWLDDGAVGLVCLLVKPDEGACRGLVAFFLVGVSDL